MIRFRFFNKIIILLFVVFYFCDLILYIGSLYDNQVINPKNITLIIFVPLFFLSILTGSIKLNSLLNKPIVRWLLIYLLLSVYALTLGVDRDAAYTNFRGVIFACLIVFMITGLMDNPRNRQFAVKVMIAGMVGSSLINVTEFLGITHIGLFGGRPAGFYINPNSAGIALGFGLVLITEHVPVRWRTLFVLLTGIGMTFTFSRAAFIFFILYFIYYLFIQKSVSRQIKFIICILILGIGFIFNQKVLSVFNSNDPGMDRNVESRTSFMLDPFAHKKSIESDSRVAFLRYALDRYLENPVLGHGLGYDQTMFHNGIQIESHNEIVHLLLNYGIIGLFILIYFWVRMHKRLDPANKIYFRNVLLTFIYFCFFSHNLFDEYSMLFIIGFMGASLPQTSKQWRRKQPMLLSKPNMVSA